MTAALKDPEGTVEKLRTAVTRPMAPEVLSQAQAPVSWLIYAALADGGENLTLSYCSTSDTAESTELLDAEALDADAAMLSELKRRLAFRYPYAEAVDLPSKVTATELKGHAEPDPDGERLVQDINYSFRMPELGDEERKLTAAERGVATHLVLQYMDFSKGRSLDGIRSEIDRLRAARFISAREAEAVNARAIERLFASPWVRACSPPKSRCVSFASPCSWMRISFTGTRQRVRSCCFRALSTAASKRTASLSSSTIRRITSKPRKTSLPAVNSTAASSWPTPKPCTESAPSPSRSVCSISSPPIEP